jgi:hypothetical protein
MRLADLGWSRKKLVHVNQSNHTLGFELTTLVVIGTDCTGSWKFNYHTITTMTAFVFLLNYHTITTMTAFVFLLNYHTITTMTAFIFLLNYHTITTMTAFVFLLNYHTITTMKAFIFLLIYLFNSSYRVNKRTIFEHMLYREYYHNFSLV